MKFVRQVFCALIAALGLVASAAQAFPLSTTGTIAADNEVVMTNFTLATASTLTAMTLSYAGGTSANGTTISTGGFDTVLSLFDSTGLLIASNDDGTAAQVGADPATGNHYDAFLSLALAAGNYVLALTQADNFATGPFLSDGFQHDNDADPNFTGPTFLGSAGQCLEAGGAQRTCDWALDILATPVNQNPGTPVPSPGVPALLCAGLIALAATRRLKRTQRNDRT